MYCRKCGKEILNDSLFCVHCGSETNGAAIPNGKPDAINVGIGILCFFIPIIGLFLWLKHKNTKPLYAKSAGLGGLIGIPFAVFAVGFFVWGIDALLSFVLKVLLK